MRSIKLTIPALLVYILMASCSHNSEPTKVVQSDSVSLKQQFISLMSGAWVLSDYVTEIERTRSPLKSAVKLQGIVAMAFDGNGKGDTARLIANLNNHEGSDFNVYFVDGLHPRKIKTNIPDYDAPSNYIELGYEADGKDTVLVLYRYNKEHKMLDKKEYRRVVFADKGNADLINGLQCLVNQKIFAGNYILINKEKNAETKVTLREDGTIVGVGEIEKYRVQTDFIGGPVDSLDKICFQGAGSKRECLIFQVVQDTINIFHENKGRQPGVGQLFYRLVRLK